LTAGHALSDSITFVHDHLQIILPVIAALGYILLSIIVPAMIAYATTAWGAATASLALAAPVLLVAAAIAAVVAVAVWLYQTFPQVRAAVASVAQFFVQLWQVIQTQVWPALQQLGSYLTGVFLAAWKSVSAYVTGTLLPFLQQVGTLFARSLPDCLEGDCGLCATGRS